MTSAAPVAPASRPGTRPAARRAGFGYLLLREWTKIRSVRSTIWTLIVFVVVTVGFTALFTWLTVANWNGPRAATRDATIVADPVNFILGAGTGLGQLAIAVLGALLISTEYSTGVIRASLLAVPRRIPMLTAKAVVFAALILVVAEIVTFSSFFLGSAIVHSHVAVSLSDPGVARAVVGTGLSLTVSGLLPGSWGAHVNAYLPEQAGSLITQAHQQSGDLLSPWQGFGVFCLWTVVLLCAAGYLLQRRDA